MKTYIVSWTTTVEAADADTALTLAQADLKEGNITPDVEEADEPDVGLASI